MQPLSLVTALLQFLGYLFYLPASLYRAIVQSAISPILLTLNSPAPEYRSYIQIHILPPNAHPASENAFFDQAATFVNTSCLQKRVKWISLIYSALSTLLFYK